ncbi:MAG TPA: DNA-binding response regulator [Lachnoclostridium sp.]|uniref:LytR/AlgR family response regulator transcription factor n=1 Tax=Lacrimispora celerecrescens TaxID=29354 RepID=UPI000E968855|nr:LytTR family DNA-binding domain-containing protein [Lacrimispora celerecrescens]HBE84381.1 DNA-binding response regulator [Lachnoclostridium sp.]
MFSVCICENNIMTFNKYKEILDIISKKHDIDISIMNFQSGEVLLQVLNNYLVDIIFMDIYLEGMNGIETARRLQQNGLQPPLIFVTKSETHVFEAFDVRPINYLIKGKVTVEEFERVFLRAVDIAKRRRKELLLCKVRDCNIVLQIKDIAYIKVTKRLITVCYKGREIKFYSSLVKLEQQLQDYNFLRIHRSYIVNLLHITTFCSNYVILKNGNKIPMGATYVNELKQAFFNLYGETKS